MIMWSAAILPQVLFAVSAARALLFCTFLDASDRTVPMTKFAKIDMKLKSDMAKIDKKRVQLKEQLKLLTAQYTVRSEALRKVQKKMARAALTATAKKKVGRGRPQRWPGLCAACMKRFFDEEGGPRHLRRLCKKTKRHIRVTY